MKQSGLKNRFPDEVKEFWADWFTDMIDGMNDADCLHHIKSPCSVDYVAGDHNQSIFNSCPLNNFRNHIGHPMHLLEKERMLIDRVGKAVMERNYKPNERDCRFLKIYKIIKTKI